MRGGAHDATRGGDGGGGGGGRAQAQNPRRENNGLVEKRTRGAIEAENKAQGEKNSLLEANFLSKIGE